MNVYESTRRFLCRLNLTHRWEARRTEDGERYERCAYCGKDQGIRGMPYAGQNNWVDNG